MLWSVPTEELKLNTFWLIFSAIQIFISSAVFPQSVIGRVVDDTTYLEGFTVSVFTSVNGTNPIINRAITGTDGRFRVYYVPTGIKQENNSSFLNNVLPSYPNPSAGNVNVQFSVQEQAQISIKVFDIIGQQCLSHEYNVTRGLWSVGIDLKGYASGLYITAVFANGRFIGSNKILLNNNLGRIFKSKSIF